MNKHIKKIKTIVALIGHSGVEVVENGLGGFVTISLENSYCGAYYYLEKLDKFNDNGKYWFEPYSNCEIIVGLE